MSKKIETTLGDLIKEALKTEKLTIDELYEKLVDLKYKKQKGKSKVTLKKKDIRNWINNKDFPDLDTIYDLSSILKIHPNDLLDIKNQMQDEMLKKTNPAIRRLGGKALDASRHCYKSYILFNSYNFSNFYSYLARKGTKQIRNRRI